MYEQTCLCYKKTSPLPDSTVMWYRSERELIEAFQEYIVSRDVDVITGWNIFGCDVCGLPGHIPRSHFVQT